MSATAQMQMEHQQPVYQYAAAAPVPTTVQYAGPPAVQYAHQPAAVQYVQQPAVQYAQPQAAVQYTMAAPTASYGAPAVQYAQPQAAYTVAAEPGGSVSYAAPQYQYVQQDAGQQVYYIQQDAGQQVQYVQQPQVVSYGGAEVAGAPGQVSYLQPQTTYGEAPQLQQYYVQGADGQQYLTSSVEVPQVQYLQQPAAYQFQPQVNYMQMPGAEENPIAGAQMYQMPQAQQPSGMQTVQSMVMPMPQHFASNQPADGAPSVTPTPPPAGQQAAAEHGQAPGSTKMSSKPPSKKTASKKAGKSSKKKKSGCC